LPDPNIKNNVKIDIWGAADGGVFKYGLSTIRKSEKDPRGIQQFTAKFLNQITNTKQISPKMAAKKK